MFLEVIQARNIMYGGDREGGRPFIDKDIGEKVGGRVRGLGGRGKLKWGGGLLLIKGTFCRRTFCWRPFYRRTFCRRPFSW